MTLYKLFIASPSHSPCCCYFLLVVYCYCSCCCLRRCSVFFFHLFFFNFSSLQLPLIFLFLYLLFYFFISLYEFSAANNDNTTIATHTNSDPYSHCLRDSEEYSSWTIRWKTLSRLFFKFFILFLCCFPFMAAPYTSYTFWMENTQDAPINMKANAKHTE